MAAPNPVNVTEIHTRNENYDALKELSSKIGVNLAVFADQDLPLQVFPTPNTSLMLYKSQVSMLESQYETYHDIMYEGDSIENKAALVDARMENDALILRQILNRMMECSTQMENRLLDLGKNIPSWDEVLQYENIPNWDKILNGVEIEQIPSTSSKSTKASVKATKSREQRGKITKRKLEVKREKIGIFKKPPTTMTKNEAQMTVAQIMLARSNGKNQRAKLPLSYIKSCVIQETNGEPSNQE